MIVLMIMIWVHWNDLNQRPKPIDGMNVREIIPK